METAQMMRQLEKMGTAQARKIYLRHGTPEPLFGVSFADLNALKKKIKKDHELAEGLWRSGNSDARILAAMIADPEALSYADAERWVRETDFRGLRDYVGCLVAASPHGLELAQKWVRSKDPDERQMALAVLANLEKGGKSVPTALSREALEMIERTIHTAENWSRYSMMYTLIGIGAYHPALTKEAIAAAKRIGKVKFDPEETNCKLPDPVPYIQKTVAHLKRKKARSLGVKAARAARPARRAATARLKSRGEPAAQVRPH